MTRVFLTSMICAFLLMATPDLGASNFGDSYGFSAKGISMGNAMTAIADDWSSVWYNIAGLGRAPYNLGMKSRAGSQSSGGMTLLKAREDDIDSGGDEKLHLNEVAISYLFSYSSNDVKGISNAKKTEALGNLTTGFLVLGLALDITTALKIPKSVVSTLRFGLGLGSPHDGVLVKVNDVTTGTPNYLRYGREVQRAVIVTGLGIGFLKDMFGFGIGVNVSFNGQGKMNVYGIELSPDSQALVHEVKMDMGISPSAVVGFYLSPGQLAPVVKGLNFGFSYRQESVMNISPFKAETEMAYLGATLFLNCFIMDYYTPHTITTGLAYTILERATISLDFEYQLWSKFGFSSQRGVSNVPKFNDVWMIKFGADVLAIQLMTVSLGYYYQPSIVPDSVAKGAANVLDNEKHVVSLGANFRLPQYRFTGGPVFISLTYQMQYLMERTVAKTTPTPENPSYTYGGTMHNLMLSLSMQI